MSKIIEDAEVIHMIGFFKRRETPRDIQIKLGQLEQTLRQLAERQAEYRIHIETLNIDKPLLEQLMFRMDALDIGELSGTLNLGNNFGAVRGKEAEQMPKPTPKRKPNHQQEMESTRKGYKVTM